MKANLPGYFVGGETPRYLKQYQKKDTGCELAPLCTECPFPDCMHDGNFTQAKTLKQAVLMREALETKSVKEVAEQFHVTTRTIYRSIDKLREYENGQRISFPEPNKVSSQVNGQGNQG